MTQTRPEQPGETLCPECGHPDYGNGHRDHTSDCSKQYCDKCGTHTDHYSHCPYVRG